MIKQAFADWIWSDPARREELVNIYNEKFNSVRPREYDGSHIQFSGMNTEIELRQHQKNAVARIMYGGNSLLGHVVGAGKTCDSALLCKHKSRLWCPPFLAVRNGSGCKIIQEQWAGKH